ncbi:lysophospholipid acyltransferase family protein [Candidatus Oscillochloris fontis]|uniref:lysophospholipid acyltransferase family protein n=1 Tax=Candidatus Oscillochloris fontis TaxID=2496868 RepID=UPI00101D397D|nr:lysophospholipid acyltransferase family protein [Candidatus Oscillochloris fontis]
MSEPIEIEVAGSSPTPPESVEIDVSNAPAAEESKPAVPNKRRSRKQTSSEAVEPPHVEEPAAPPPPPLPNPASAWSTQPSEDLFEVELEVRNRGAQADPHASSTADIAAGLLSLVGENMRRMTEEQVNKVNEMLGGTDLRDYLDPDFWKGVGMVLQYQVQEQVEFIKRRARGEYTIDPYGLDPDIIEIVRPFVSFMYHTWWRVQAQGLEHVPAEGRALLVANHSGVLPWDGAMIASAVASEHPERVGRVVRSLHLHWFTTLPFIAPALAATGQVPGLPENAVRLLENDELVCVFPEGIKGVGKLYKDRYKLARFGRGGFIQVALRTGAPIVPVAVVGAEEIYPMLHNAESIAKMLGFPYFPITPFFPWLGLLGTIPLPTRWNITFCPPISTEEYGPRGADDPLTVLSLAERVRDTIQETINTRLAERTSIF